MWGNVETGGRRFVYGCDWPRCRYADTAAVVARVLRRQQTGDGGNSKRDALRVAQVGWCHPDALPSAMADPDIRLQRVVLVGDAASPPSNATGGCVAPSAGGELWGELPDVDGVAVETAKATADVVAGINDKTLDFVFLDVESAEELEPLLASVCPLWSQPESVVRRRIGPFLPPVFGCLVLLEAISAKAQVAWSVKVKTGGVIMGSAYRVARAVDGEAASVARNGLSKSAVDRYSAEKSVLRVSVGGSEGLWWLTKKKVTLGDLFTDGAL